MPRLTIGMAVFDDFNGLFFTVQSLGLYHGLDLPPDTELIVVDNAPHTAQGQITRGWVEAWPTTWCKPRYIAMREPVGTTQSRQRIFDEANGEFVLVMDSHVMIAPGAIKRTMAYLDARPNTKDLYTGPIMFDHLRMVHTHFNAQWREEMWGTWGNAWRCRCGQQGVMFSPMDITNPTAPEQLRQTAHWVALDLAATPIGMCGTCGAQLPPQGIPWAGHEGVLQKAGFDMIGWNESDPPFEIPAAGLGLFLSRRDAWLGFNRHCRGFGAEEVCLHHKYRQAGRKTWCLPWLKWPHRFGRYGSSAFPTPRYAKVRNYVLWFNDLKMDLAPIKEHFQALPPAKAITDDLWNYLVADPIKHENPPVVAGQTEAPALFEGDIIAAYEFLRTRPRDLDQHMPTLFEYASRCKHVTEFTKRRESTVALLAGLPKDGRLVSYNYEHDQIIDWAVKTESDRLALTVDKSSADLTAVEETDFLFIDQEHTARRLQYELDTFAKSIRRYIALHDTLVHGERGQDGGPGFWHVLRGFIEDNPDWYVTYHTSAQYGLTILGRLPTERPTTPIVAWPPGKGPGTELHNILDLMSIKPSDACDCRNKAAQMDLWGVEGCIANRELIIGWMRDGAPRWGWADKLKAATMAVVTGIAFKVNWLDPFPDLIDESIRRAGL